MNSENIPPIDAEEIILALNQMKNGRAAGKYGILAEMLKYAGYNLIEELNKLSNKRLKQEDIPSD